MKFPTLAGTLCEQVASQASRLRRRRSEMWATRKTGGQRVSDNHEIGTTVKGGRKIIKYVAAIFIRQDDHGDESSFMRVDKNR
ncbi:hypothetical protein PoB_000190700 [Plakobranchus ocellatus]|uniref:Uncharacterized protein n=1 Tax=Plakobranchus ocellatus TaxID=259542 RepID=A0AAV3XZ35_9GAST|nr:hypothetical protein PoB_000190700 [Plakobranchus ocellatus]